MLRIPLYAISAGLVLLVAGCGLQQVQPKSSNSSTPTVPTPVPTPKVTVKGGSVAAVVNGSRIPMSRFKAFLKYGMQQAAATPGASASPKTVAHQTIQNLVRNELILEYAAKHGLSVTASQVRSQINNDIRQAGGKSSFQTDLARTGFTMADIRYITDVNLLGPRVRDKVAPLVRSGPVATARHILIRVAPTKDRCQHKALTNGQARSFAKHLLQEIKSGAKSFAAAARQCSDDNGTSGSARHSGLLQTPSGTQLYPGQFVPKFDHAVFHGPVDALQLVHSRFGYHIIQVISRHHGKYPTSASSVLQSKDFSVWLAKHQKDAKVTIKEKVK